VTNIRPALSKQIRCGPVAPLPFAGAYEGRPVATRVTTYFFSRATEPVAP
jgi:hypothetical protein